MKYLLDTNICSYIIKHKPIEILHKFNRISKGHLFISSITTAELHYWRYKNKKLHEKSKNIGNPKINALVISEFMRRINVLDFDESAAEVYGELRTELEFKGNSIGNMDLMIGAHALSVKAVLVTNNVKEFKRLPHLKIENWLSHS